VDIKDNPKSLAAKNSLRETFKRLLKEMEFITCYTRELPFEPCYQKLKDLSSDEFLRLSIEKIDKFIADLDFLLANVRATYNFSTINRTNLGNLIVNLIMLKKHLLFLKVEKLELLEIEKILGFETSLYSKTYMEYLKLSAELVEAFRSPEYLKFVNHIGTYNSNDEIEILTGLHTVGDFPKKTTEDLKVLQSLLNSYILSCDKMEDGKALQKVSEISQKLSKLIMLKYELDIEGSKNFIFKLAISVLLWAFKAFDISDNFKEG